MSHNHSDAGGGGKGVAFVHTPISFISVTANCGGKGNERIEWLEEGYQGKSVSTVLAPSKKGLQRFAVTPCANW